MFWLHGQLWRARIVTVALRRPGSTDQEGKVLPMDTDTIIALCEILLVVIAILELVLRRRE